MASLLSSIGDGLTNVSNDSFGFAKNINPNANTGTLNPLPGSTSAVKGRNFYGVHRGQAIHRDSTQTKIYHGLSIIYGNNIVGRISSWQPQMFTRAGTHVFEIGALSYGRPVDYVPGRGDNYSIQASRTEIWDGEIEKELGFDDVWSDLISQRKPFSISEKLFRGFDVYRQWKYHNCWFSSKNEKSFEAETQDGVVAVDMTINFVSRIKVS